MGVWGWHVYSAVFKTAIQQGPTVQYRELCSIFCNNLCGEEIRKRIDMCIYLTELLRCTPETNMALLINCTII